MSGFWHTVFKNIRKKYSKQLSCNTKKLQWILLFTLSESYAKWLQNLTQVLLLQQDIEAPVHHPLKLKASRAVLGAAQRSSCQYCWKQPNKGITSGRKKKHSKKRKEEGEFFMILHLMYSRAVRRSSTGTSIWIQSSVVLLSQSLKNLLSQNATKKKIAKQSVSSLFFFFFKFCPALLL